jgi:hypothetical protein
MFLTGDIGHESAYLVKSNGRRCLICHLELIFTMDAVQKPCIWWQQLPAWITEPPACSNEQNSLPPPRCGGLFWRGETSGLGVSLSVQ